MNVDFKHLNDWLEGKIVSFDAKKNKFKIETQNAWSFATKNNKGLSLPSNQFWVSKKDIKQTQESILAMNKAKQQAQGMN